MGRWPRDVCPRRCRICPPLSSVVFSCLALEVASGRGFGLFRAAVDPCKRAFRGNKKRHVRCGRGAAAWGPAGPDGGAATSAFRAAAAVVEHLEHAIRRDWDRANEDVRLLSEDVGSAMFSGRDPSLSKEGFLARWGLQGRLCDIRQDGSLLVRLSLDSPVPVPGLLQE